MSKIKSIELKNFKFFTNNISAIDINGKHLLMYGENGSGKSSIFWGVYTLLEASIKEPSKVQSYFKDKSSAESLVNAYAGKLNDGATGIEHYQSYVSITDDSDKQYKVSLLDTAICGNKEAKESRSASDFINYQSLYELSRKKNSQNTDLADVFIDVILPYIEFSPNILNGRVDNAGEQWDVYRRSVEGNFGAVYNKGSKQYDEYIKFCDSFDRQMTEFVSYLTTKANEIIDKLGYDFIINLTYAKPKDHSKRERGCFSLLLTASFVTPDGIFDIERPHKFFNEARLVAIAIALRLAVLDKRPKDVNGLKFLALDDIMISLDMSNRKALVNLLKERYIRNYQLLIFTHDERFYRYLKNEFSINESDPNSKWECYELYACEDNSIIKPVVIPSKATPLEKATRFCLCGEYETASMWVRKSLEMICSNALPKELCIDKNGNSHTLHKLWGLFVDRYRAEIKKIDNKLIDDYNNLKFAILNPSAHYNRLSMPVFKREIERAINIAKTLEGHVFDIPTILAVKGDEFLFSHPNMDYKFRFKLTEDMIKGDTNAKEIKNLLCDVVTWSYKGVEFYDFGVADLKKKLTSEPMKLRYLIKGLLDNDTLDVTQEMFLQHTKFCVNWSLAKLIGANKLI